MMAECTDTMSVEGGQLELENEENHLSSPLLLCLRGGHNTIADDDYEQQQQEHQIHYNEAAASSPPPELEHTVQPDGSIHLTKSTRTLHPNGYHDIKIEHYVIPSTSPDSMGPIVMPINNKYLTRVEYKTIISNGLDDDDDGDASTVYTALPRRKDDGSVTSGSYYTARGTRRRRRHRLTRTKKSSNYKIPIILVGMVIFLIGIISVAVTRDRHGRAVENARQDGDDLNNKNDTTAVVPDDNGTNGTSEGEVIDHHHHHNHHYHYDDEKASISYDEHRSSVIHVSEV